MLNHIRLKCFQHGIDKKLETSLYNQYVDKGKKYTKLKTLQKAMERASISDNIKRTGDVF